MTFFSAGKDYREEGYRVQAIYVEGRTYGIRVNYLKEHTSNYFLKTFQTIIYVERETHHGHILVFLTSVEEIEGMQYMLDSYAHENRRSFRIMALHAGLSLSKQADIFEDSSRRKVILATNVAESSITIPDIKYVIDCGYVKIKVYDQQAGVEKMIVVPCGKSSAIQRAGRAGRVVDG